MNISGHIYPPSLLVLNQIEDVNVVLNYRLLTLEM